MKIGLIAMSGVRACDAELLKLGLTLPGFVERSKTIASLPSLGLLTLAGMTPKEHEVRYIEIADLASATFSCPWILIWWRSPASAAQIKEGYELARRFTVGGNSSDHGWLARYQRSRRTFEVWCFGSGGGG